MRQDNELTQQKKKGVIGNRNLLEFHSVFRHYRDATTGGTEIRFPRAEPVRKRATGSWAVQERWMDHRSKER